MNSRFGLWAAVAAFIASVAYGIPQILQVAGLLHDPWDRILIFAPSLALAPAFVLTMAAVCETSGPDRRVFGLAGFGLAIMYAVLVSTVYVTQLGVVIPHDLKGDAASVAFLACCGQGKFTTGLDLLGYTLMSLSTLVATPLFAADGAQRWPRYWLLANGALAPFLLGQLVWPSLIYVGALWLVTFPMSMAALARWFGLPPRNSSISERAPRGT